VCGDLTGGWWGSVIFFVAALGWGPAGGLDIGQAFHVASTIKDGDADSWVSSFSRYAEVQTAVALADLPGQGITQAEGLHWEVEAEKPRSWTPRLRATLAGNRRCRSSTASPISSAPRFCPIRDSRVFCRRICLIGIGPRGGVVSRGGVSGREMA
jgi:hypothetical protein